LEIQEYVQRVARNAEQIFVGPSHGSATGNDQTVYRNVLRRVNTNARIIVAHDVEPTSKRRVHMKKGLYELVRENTDHVGEDNNPLTDVLVRGLDQVEEILQTSPEEWDLIMEDVLNFFSEGEKGTLRAPQVRRKSYDHEVVVEHVVDHVTGTTAPQRLREGDPTLSPEERNQIVGELERDLRAIRESVHANIPPSSFQGLESKALDGDPEYPEQALVKQSRRAVAEAIQEDVPGIEKHVHAVYEHAFDLGYESVLERLESCIEDVEDTIASTGTDGENGTETSLAEAARQYVDGFSTLQLIFSKTGLSTNGGAQATRLYRACANEYQSRRQSGVLNLLRELSTHMRDEISGEGVGADEEGSSPFDLSGLPDEVLDEVTAVYLQATENNAHPEEALRSAVEERLPRIIDALVEQDIERGRFAFPFEVERSQLGREGVLVRSPFPKAIEGPQIFHIDPEHSHRKTTDEDVTVLLRYNVLKYIQDAPELRRMFRRIEQEVSDSEDRRDHMVDASTIYPLPLFERPGDLEEEQMSLLLAKAFFSKGALHVYDDRIEFHLNDEKKTFASFETYCRTLPPEWGFSFHEQFWNDTFAPNRDACIGRIERAAEGSPYKKDEQRLKRIKDFAGSRSFNKALSTLGRRVRVASRYWE